MFQVQTLSAYTYDKWDQNNTSCTVADEGTLSAPGVRNVFKMCRY